MTPSDMRIGKVYRTNNSGYLEVFRYVNRNEVLVRFIETGTKVWTRSQYIRSGLVRDPMYPSVFGVGYVGIGSERSGLKGVKEKPYECWHSMMSRCYSEVVHSKFPTYKDCTVCEEWHNFQNFAAWYKDNYPNDGASYELDKDILLTGNRIYSPEACKFVTSKENSSFSKCKTYAFATPKKRRTVIVSNLVLFCEKLNIDPSCMRRVFNGGQKSHKGWVRCSTRGIKLLEQGE